MRCSLTGPGMIKIIKLIFRTFWLQLHFNPLRLRPSWLQFSTDLYEFLLLLWVRLDHFLKDKKLFTFMKCTRFTPYIVRNQKMWFQVKTDGLNDLKVKPQNVTIDYNCRKRFYMSWIPEKSVTSSGRSQSREACSRSSPCPSPSAWTCPSSGGWRGVEDGRGWQIGRRGRWRIERIRWRPGLEGHTSNPSCCKRTIEPLLCLSSICALALSRLVKYMKGKKPDWTKYG